MAAQEAVWLSGDEPTAALARAVAGKADDLIRRSAAPGSAASADAMRQARQLADALAAGRSAPTRDETLRHFDPEDVDPIYRRAVEDYFERLSREAPPVPAAKPTQ